ncbi:class I SAM-dependent methyltransferase [bacterium]|nr:MAG: class I SAM-dependent methyltransferase [bacterium]
MAVAWAQEKAQGRAAFVQGSVLALPCAEGSFDRVLDGHCWHCVLGIDRRSFLSEANRVLRPGGVFTGHTMIGPPSGIGAQGYDGETGQTFIDGVPVRYWTTVEGACHDLRQVGFLVERSRLTPGGEMGPDLLIIDAVKIPVM